MNDDRAARHEDDLDAVLAVFELREQRRRRARRSRRAAELVFALLIAFFAGYLAGLEHLLGP